MLPHLVGIEEIVRRARSLNGVLHSVSYCTGSGQRNASASPTCQPDASAAQLCSELTRDDGEDDVAWRDGRRHVARLDRLARPPSPPLSR